MGKRDYMPILAVLLMWLMTIATGLPLVESGIWGQMELLLLSLIIVAPLLIAIILSFRAVYKQNKEEKE